MQATDQLTVAEVSRRSGFAPSALRYYEAEGLIAAERTGGNQRRYQRQVLRRLAFVRAASVVGLTLDEIRAELASLPSGGTRARPTGAGSRGTGEDASTSRSRRSSACVTGSTRASAAAACRCGRAPSPILRT